MDGLNDSKDSPLGLPLLLYLLTKRRNKRWSRNLSYYFFQALKVNYYLLFGVGSDRVGTVITRFGIFMENNWKGLKGDDTLIWELVDHHLDGGRPLPLHGDVILTRGDISISWLGSEELVQILGDQTLCTTSNFTPLFSTGRVDPVDWRVPTPRPDFPMFRAVNEFVSNGSGFWVPQVGTTLEDVGFAFFERGTNNIL